MQAFWDWLGDHAWTAWLGLAFVLGIVELTTLDLLFLMLAGGAVGGALAAMAGLSPLVQALVAIAVSVLLLGFVRPVAKRHTRLGSGARTGAAALVGRKGVVVEQVDAEHGLIKLAGEIWTARCYDGESVIEEGRDVDVIEIKGATALVFEADSPSQVTELRPKGLLWNEIAAPHPGIEQLTTHTLRDILGRMDVERALTSHEYVTTAVRRELEKHVRTWGIQINFVDRITIVQEPSGS